MRSPQALLVGLGIGLGLGLLAGAVLWEGEGAAVQELSAELEAARAEIVDLDQRLAAAESEPRRTRRRPDEGSSAVGEAPAPVDSDGGTARPASADPDRPPMDAAARRSRVDALRAEADTWFEKGDGEGALAALKELAALVPEGREAAMDLAVRMNADVNGENALEMSVYEFYIGLGDPAVKALMGWSLENPSAADFRVMAAYSLPWTQSADATVKQFVDVLGSETDVRVQRALVANLARLSKDESRKALHDLFLDGGRDAQLRAQIATELATSDDAEILRAIEQAAANDASERVRSAAKAALVARDPPATGYLITGTVPRSQGEAAGLVPGDILVSYNGRATATPDELRKAAAETGELEEVAVVVVRDGQEVTVHCRPGRLGVYGRAVEAAED
jgi:hypothetical protein